MRENRLRTTVEKIPITTVGRFIEVIRKHPLVFSIIIALVIFALIITFSYLVLT